MTGVTTFEVLDTTPAAALTVGQLKELIRTELASVVENRRHDDQLLTIEEAAAKLQKSKDWLYRQSNKLPFMRRIGRDLRCSEKELDKWVARRTTTC